MKTYDTTKLADRGFGDAGNESTCEMDDTQVRELAAVHGGQPKYAPDGSVIGEHTMDDLIAEIQACEI